MTLKKKIFISFCVVSLLALLIAVFALCWINLHLSLKLYGDNLSNSTQIQANMLEEQINRFLVRATRFANSEYIVNYLMEPAERRTSISTYHGVADEILHFTDETMDSITTFSIVDLDGEILYVTGTASDGQIMKKLLETIPISYEQEIIEVSWMNDVSTLAIVTPILSKKDKSVLGNFVTVYNADYFLKNISLHQQFSASNAFIYCGAHQQIVKTKYPFQAMEHFSVDLNSEDEPDKIARIDGEDNIVRWQRISRTPWVLVNSIPMRCVYSQTLSYLLLGIAVLAVSFLVVLVLSKRQSQHILYPLERLLEEVERFLLSDAKIVPQLDFDKKTEIGCLADKFSHMASDIALAQRSLRESNYLYNSILYSAYYFRIYIDLERNEASSSHDTINQYFKTLSHDVVNQYLKDFDFSDAHKIVMSFFEHNICACSSDTVPIFKKIVNGDIRIPQEIEVCMQMSWKTDKIWFHVLAVPIVENDQEVTKVVLHFEDINEKKLEELRLVESSRRDLHTGLLNKNTFSMLAQEELDQNLNNCAVFFIDLDSFKKINDFLGHAAGDNVLIEAVRKITTKFRASDLVARYGGDEFVAFVAGIVPADAEKKAAELVDCLVVERYSQQAGTIRVTASVGVCISHGINKIDDLVNMADKAMYSAKENGKGQYYIVKVGNNDERNDE